MNIDIQNNPSVSMTSQGSSTISVSTPDNVLQGPRGYSAYEIAVQNGFKGTEQQFIDSLKGPQGERGPKGDTGPIGLRGYTGNTGPSGPQGIPGISPTIEVKENTEDKYILEITDATGTFDTPNLKGPKGESSGGGTGGSGQDGFSPIVEVNPIDNGTRVSITDKEGTKTFDVLNGEKGDKGDPGEKGEPGQNGTNVTDGKTPEKGIDYFTEADKEELVQNVLNALPSAEGVEF